MILTFFKETTTFAIIKDKIYKKKGFHTLLHRISEPSAFIQVVAGPRQVGKSTLISQVLAATDIPHILYNADTVDSTDGDWISRCWENARAMKARIYQSIPKFQVFNNALFTAYHTETFF